jgi:serine/threonine-protein kinase HipA
LGQDLPGAITVRPADGEAWPSAVDEAAGSDEGAALAEHALRFSLAGVQLKFSAINDTSGGLTIPAQGVGGSWIVKLPSREFKGVPENEFSMLTLARHVGIDVPPVKLVSLKSIGNLPDGITSLEGQALAIERFDRRQDGSLVHIEDFAQVFGLYPRHKYNRASALNIANVIGVEGTDADIAEFIRRLTFNTLIGNADMHVKNWSVIYPDRRRFALAPAYDFVSTIAYIPDDNAALKFSRTKRFDSYSRDELSHLANRAHLPEKLVLDTAADTYARFNEAWHAEKTKLPLVPAIIDAIEAHLKTISLG